MNRAFAITGILAATMAVLWMWIIVCSPWFAIYSLRSPAPSIWLLWALISAAGVALLFAFVRYSLPAHWTALRRNAPMPSIAWRCVGGIYLMTASAFALPVFSGNPSGTHRAGMYLYCFLAGLSLLLAGVAFRRGFRRSG